LNNLVNDLLSVGVVLSQNMSPELRALSLNQISCLHSVEVVTVGNFYKFVIARSPSALVSNKGQVWVALFAVLTNNLAVIIWVVDQESLGVLVNIDIDDGKSVVKGRFLNALFIPGLKPALKELQLSSSLKLVYQFGNRAGAD